MLRWPHSLKHKLITVLLLSSLIPLVLIGIISYYTIYSILDNKIEQGLRNNLSQVRLSIAAALDQLNNVSQQLSFEGSAGMNVVTYLTTTDLYEKKIVYNDILREINLISFSNPTLALICYYIPERHDVLFPNYYVSGNFRLDALPVFADYTDQRGFTYFGPHRTMRTSHGNTVLSVAREVQTTGAETMYVFIEAEINDLFERHREQMNTAYLIVDNNGTITYSSDEKVFARGEPYLQHNNEHYYFEDKSTQGWMMVSAISKLEYNREINQWLLLFFVLGVSSLGLSLLFAWTIWRTVYKPVRSISREIESLSRSDFHSPIRLTNVKEFDFLLRRFDDMRQKVWDLLMQVQEKEKRKASLEVEKLLYQINPHFIHNTLDTIRWLARMSGHDEIDRSVSSLNKVLYYNLGKGVTATIEDELEALKNYVSLQRIRYNFQFDVRFETDPAIAGALIPRFVLQPLVENALYHGGMLDDDGVIRVHIALEDGRTLLMRVTDNGTGMDETVIARLTGDEPLERGSKSGMGIGLNYVRRMLHDQFGESASFQITSEPGNGTQITLRIPFQRKEQ